MDSAKRLVINVVTWNSARYLPNLFASLDAQTSDEFTVTVVDNVSSDSTLQWLETHRKDAGAAIAPIAEPVEGDMEGEVAPSEEPPTRAAFGLAVLRNFRNQGFARGHNQAIALALSRWDEQDLDRRYIMIGNPDLEFDTTCVERLISFMDEHPDVAACGPKLLRAITSAEGDDGRLEAERTNVIDAMGIALTKTRRVVDRGAGEEDKGQYDRDTRVFGLSGACVVIRASMLQKIRQGEDWFDGDFFAYKEDADLAWRMRLLGLEARVVPLAVAWHHRRSPGHPGGWLASWRIRQGKSPHINFYSTRNHGWLLLKNDSPVNLLLHAPWWLPYELAKFVSGIFSPTHWKAEFASLAGFPLMLRKRKAFKKRIAVPPQEMRKWFV